MTLTFEILAEKTLSGELKTFKDLHRIIENKFRYKNGEKNIRGLSSALKGDLKKVGTDSSFEKKKETVANSFSMYLESVVPKEKKTEKQETIAKPIAKEQESLQGSFEIIDEVYARPVEILAELTQETITPREEAILTGNQSEQLVEVVPETKITVAMVQELEVEQVEETGTFSPIWLLAQETLAAGWFQEMLKKEEQAFYKAMKSKSIVFRKNKEMKDIYTVVKRARKKAMDNEKEKLKLLAGYFDKTVRVSKK